jgi:hypothetical protein
MTDRPRTVGDLPADAVVLRYTNGQKVHLPGADCAQLARNSRREPKPKRAATLFDDEPICKDCRGDAFRQDCGGPASLPTSVEVVGDV